MPCLIWLLFCCNLHGEAQVSSDVRCVKSLCKYPFECPYHLFYPWMKPCAPDCCSMREPSWTCGVQRRSMAIQSWIGGALSLCWSLRQAYCCRHIRPTTSQQRTTKLVLLRTFGVRSSTMTNARKTSRRSVVNVCCNCTGATTKGPTGRTCGDTSNCFLRVAIT